MANQMPIHWQGHLVGYIAEPNVDNFHLYGRWIPEGTAVSTQFTLALASALRQFEKEFAGVDVCVGGTISGEVTDLDGDIMNILMQPGTAVDHC
jgi:hypothetical protein